VSEGWRGHTEAPGYLDSASSEPLHPAAREAMVAALDKGWADPRRLHGAARNARLLLDNAREVVAECLELRRDEVSFTSSGTDAVHRGLLGLVPRPGARSTTILVSAVEHSSVLHAQRWSAEHGGDAMVAATDRLGRPVSGAWSLAREEEVGVAALQSANHEVGTVQHVAEAAAELGGIPLFVDACASMGRLALPDGWAAAAGSAHKWGGPAGVGLLLVRKGVRWTNPFPADDRVDERATGFENVPAALGAAAALQAVVAERDEVNARQFALVDRVRAKVQQIPDVEVVGDPVDRLPHVVTFSFLYVDGEAIVDALNRRGLAVASGSACTSSTLEPSHVLSAMGVLTHGNVRVSLTRDTTEAEVDQLLAVLPEAVAQIRAEVGL
jgi:cysteine desulfurase